MHWMRECGTADETRLSPVTTPVRLWWLLRSTCACTLHTNPVSAVLRWLWLALQLTASRASHPVCLHNRLVTSASTRCSVHATLTNLNTGHSGIISNQLGVRKVGSIMTFSGKQNTCQHLEPARTGTLRRRRQFSSHLYTADWLI